MEIETKFDVGEDLWFIQDNEVCSSPVSCVIVILNQNNREECGEIKNHIQIKYGLGFDSIKYLPETEVFESKEELLKSLYYES